MIPTHPNLGDPMTRKTLLGLIAVALCGATTQAQPPTTPGTESPQVTAARQDVATASRLLG